MAVRSKRLVAALSGGAAVHAVYTAAAGETVLVKHVDLYGRLSTPGVLTLSVVTQSGQEAALLQVSLGLGESLNQEVWWALQPGDSLSVRSTVTNGYSVFASGAELEGVAD